MSDTASHQFLDAELTRRSQAGDAEAFGELITKYRVKIFTVVFSMVHNEYDDWDIAQEGFLKAWRSIQRFEGQSSFYTWLYSITVNLTIMRACRPAAGNLTERRGVDGDEASGPGGNGVPKPSINGCVASFYYDGDFHGGSVDLVGCEEWD